MKIGILALQGAIEQHEEKLRALEIHPVKVKYPKDLKNIGGIILPGGESTTMIHLLKLHSLFEPLAEFVSAKPSLGVCAGAILLAKEVRSPSQKSLGTMNIVAHRNAYGRQINSFIADLEPTEHWQGPPKIEGIFIRAPRLSVLNNGANVLLRHKQDNVLIEQDNQLAASFHPELANSCIIHEYFVDKVRRLY